MSESPGTVRFEYEGREILARPGQTIAGALHDAGVTIVSRSFKYHRPRGLFCMTGRCPNCLCNVDGEPNVRICTEPARSGAVVKTQNAWPSVERDALGILDKFDAMMPVGFYYKSMHKPRFLWPLAEKVVRNIAGLGVVDEEHGAEGRYEKVHQHTDVAVVGGGIAGLAAALEAAKRGCSVTLVDDQPQLGGHVRYDPRLDFDAEQKRDMMESVLADEAIQIHSSATAFGSYEGGLLGIQQGSRMIRLRSQATVFATGGWERPLLFNQNDLPGVLLASAAQRLVVLDGCKLDGSVLVVTDNQQGYRVAQLLHDQGMHVAGICDLNKQPLGEVLGVPRFAQATVAGVAGKKHVRSASVASLDGSFIQDVPCRWVVQAVGFVPATGLPYQSGCKFDHVEALGQAVLTSGPANIFVAGSANGYTDAVACVQDGVMAGNAAAAHVQGVARSHNRDVWRATLSRTRWRSAALPAAQSPPLKKQFVCLCEDVSDKDIRDAVTEGYDNIETLKRYSTVCMGPCQGKMCQANSIEVCAAATGRSIGETGRTTSRPPEQPVPLGVLAGRSVDLQLTRRTSMHAWHEGAGASFLDAGAWKRPEHYGDPAGEYAAVRDTVGLIDISTLGKLQLSGKDVPEFLEFVYPNRFAGLKVGRVRYGVLCDEAGILIDDGTIARLEENSFFLTATTGNADAVDSWFRWWLACRPQWDVRMTNVSTAMSAVNLAGPRSRDVLSRVCDEDVSAEALPYLAAAQRTIAGVPATVLRIGFVGELGFEIHVPAQFGLHLWETLLEVGQSEGIRPFGVEAQRRLRLDKQHFLPGVDTDALSTPFSADVPWIVKLDKPDFIGRASLQRSQDPHDQLVGFTMAGSEPPEEASLVVADGALCGRVTSARFSPVTNSIVGLAWVKTSQANHGEVIQIRIGNRLATAIVHTDPFYDPAGTRLHS